MENTQAVQDATSGKATDATAPVSGNRSTSPAPGSGGYFIFLVIYLALLSAFGSFVNDMYLPTLPAMKRAFMCSTSTVQL